MALSPAQLATLKAAILADPVLAAQPLNADGAYAIAVEMNKPAAPAFTVWRSRVPFDEVADNTAIADLSAMTSANVNRYQTVMSISPNGVVPTTDRRAGFEDIFGGAAGATTRAKLGLAGVVWKRLATRAEKLFATGTGSDAVPATLTFEGQLGYPDVVAARDS
jgi:hypothetical protein